MSVIAIACSLVVGNAIYTMATGTHLRSGVNIKESWTGAENQINEVVADRGKIKDRNGNTIAEDLETYSISDGRRLSKRDGDQSLENLRARYTAEDIVGRLAYAYGLQHVRPLQEYKR